MPRMTERTEPLARFTAALHGALDATVQPGTEAAAAASRITSALLTTGPAGETKPASLDVCQHLDTALDKARCGPPNITGLSESLERLAPNLAWWRRTGSTDHDTAFYDGHANSWIIGPDGLEQRSDVMVGVSLVAPGVTYPEHRHPPEEIYIVLSEGEWYREDVGWYRPGPGAIVHHHPDVVHAMRAGADPLLAVWCLQSGTVR